jgi:hypothetical protein
MEAMFTLTCRAARLSLAKEKRHDDIRIHPDRQPERPTDVPIIRARR